MLFRCVIAGFIGFFIASFPVFAQTGPQEPGRHRINVTSTVDSTPQPSMLNLPSGYDPEGDARPLLVMLHSWSFGIEQRWEDWESEAASRGWLYLFPHFRGRNDHPAACGSRLAQQDILDAVDWVVQRYKVDERRIYLAGVSGGGHMTMLMVGRHPDRWAAASAWVGISDMAAWYALHADDGYGAMMRQCLGGIPGASLAVDQTAEDRSPLTWLSRGAAVPLDIAAGRHDGHDGSVPVSHSLRAFNVIADALGAEEISEREIAELSRVDGRLEMPRSTDQQEDATFGRAIYLRRYAGPSRVTIFEGGHEGIAAAAFVWLERHSKPE